MSDLSFEWDEKKNNSNQKKHGVSFDEARSVFFDESAIEFFDRKDSRSEDRFLMLGMSSSLRILLVCHCLRDSESVIRIISARKATKTEQIEYEKGV